MFDGKTLVGVGCSHTFGSFKLERGYEDRQSCYQRSWVKKMEDITGAISSVNLGYPGGSNKRSKRVTEEYVLQDLERAKNSVIIIGLTEISRTEMSIVNNFEFAPVDSSATKSYNLLTIGSWQVGNNWRFESDKRYKDFLEYYYGDIYCDEYEIDQLNISLFELHLFLKHFSVEHYFACLNINPAVLKSNALANQLKIIDFGGTHAIRFACENGFKVGNDYDPSTDCNHLDHDGNEFLARYMLDRIGKI